MVHYVYPRSLVCLFLCHPSTSVSVIMDRQNLSTFSLSSAVFSLGFSKLLNLISAAQTLERAIHSLRVPPTKIYPLGKPSRPTDRETDTQTAAPQIHTNSHSLSLHKMHTYTVYTHPHSQITHMKTNLAYCVCGLQCA